MRERRREGGRTERQGGVTKENEGCLGRQEDRPVSHMMLNAKQWELRSDILCSYYVNVQ